MEEEHEKLHRRGELVKFAALVVVLLLTVMVVAGLRPLIFNHLVPAVLGWDGEPSRPAGVPGEEPEPTSQEATLPPTLTATAESESEEAEGESEDEAEDTATPEPTNTQEPEPSSTPVTYEVQRGDRLIDIAENFGVTVEAIVQANGIVDPNRIQAGEVLVIPAP
jgi:LysM repeat protein